jgi:peptidoglycan/xylan/chitin deacetylase (PgdA/CDA1 family)
MSMETRDQEYADVTEVEAAIEYAEIAAEYGVPVTLFCTGRCAVEEPERMERLAAMDNVEIGGHNYWAFTTPVHTGWRAVAKITGGRVGSWNGPRSFQAYEIRKTLAALEDVGGSVTAWRDHAYRHDQYTLGLLADHGVTHFSDTVEPGGNVRECEGVTVVPINTPPDHEHVYHAYRTPEFVSESGFSGPFGDESHAVEAWRDWVCESVRNNTEASRPATVLAHPACMRLADGLDAFETLCERLDTEDPAFLSQITPAE